MTNRDHEVKRLSRMSLFKNPLQRTVAKAKEREQEPVISSYCRKSIQNTHMYFISSNARVERCLIIVKEGKYFCVRKELTKVPQTFLPSPHMEEPVMQECDSK